MKQTQTTTKKRAADILFAVTCLFWMSQYAYTPYLNTEMQRMGASASYIGLVGSMYGLSQTLLRLPVGLLADRLGRQKPFVVLGSLAVTVSGFGMFLLYRPAGFLVFRLLAGVSAASWVNFTVLYSGYFDAAQSPKKLSLLNMANQGGRLIAYVAAGGLAVLFGERISFLVAGLAGLAALVLSLRCAEAQPSGRKPQTLRENLTVLQNRNLRVMTLLGILAQTVAFATFYSFASNLAGDMSATASQLSLLSLMVTVPVVVCNYLSARWLLDRFGARRLLIAGFVLITLYCGAVPLCTNVVQLLCLQAVSGVGVSFTMGILPGLCVKEIELARRSTAMGFFQALYGIGITAGPMIMGLIVEHLGMAAGFWCMGVLSLATVVVAVWLVPKE